MEKRNQSVGVVGAGVVGIASALHLQRAGFDVTLIDRSEPGSETSFGNAGIVCGGHYVPTAMPRAPVELLKLALNRATYARHQPSALPSFARWLAAFWAETSEAKQLETARRMIPAMGETVRLHRKLLDEANAGHLLRETGWMAVFRSEADYESLRAEADFAREAGIPFDELSVAEALDLEPHLKPVFKRAINWRANASVSDPFAVSQACLSLFIEAGGTVQRGSVFAVSPAGAGWRIVSEVDDGVFDHVVLSAGVWSADLLAPLGYAIPLKPKRGYHTHYSAQGNATLARPVVDDSIGYVLAPMARGIRVTTGIEISHRDAPADPAMAKRIDPYARDLFPLEEMLDDAPWLGRRPALPDSLPVVGPAPRHRGLWFNFGHAHLGLTLAPLTGLLIAQMIAGEETLIDPVVFTPARYA